MRQDWNSKTALLLVGGILIALNVIGVNLFGRLDLTDDKVYTLSDASRNVVSNLDDPVTVTAFFTDDLPAPYSSNRRFLKDKLDDYRAYGGQQFLYRFVDPSDDAELEEEANRFRIPPVQIQVIESDNLQLKNAYMGVAIQYGEEREVIPVLQDLSSLEYDLTSAIRRLTRDDSPTVGFLNGHGEPAPTQAYQNFYQVLSRDYEPQVVTIQDTGVMSTTPDALFVIAPTDTLPDSHLQALDTFVMGGGRVAFLLNQVDANLQVGQATAVSVGLEPLLRTYGLGLRNDLVMDRQSSVVSVQRQQMGFRVLQQIEYPFIPIASQFSPDNMMVSRLSSVMFYFASSIDTSLALPEGVNREVLASSTQQSQLQEGFFMIQPGMADPATFSGGPYPIAAAYSGSFPSAYNPGQSSIETRMVLVGDGDFVNESLLGPVEGNIEFARNMVDWLVQDDALLSIRSKKLEPRSLDPVSDGARPWIKYFNMLGPVLIVIVFGLFRWQRRKSRQIIIVK